MDGRHNTVRIVCEVVVGLVGRRGGVKLRNAIELQVLCKSSCTVLFQCQAAAFNTAQIRRMEQKNLRLRSVRM